MMPWYWGYYAPWDWLWMALVMLIFWGGVVALVVWAFRGFGAPRGESDPAIDALRNRLASGQISQEEFERTKRALQG
ncbi:MAG TPA: SHOCT domain-containing protein [Actinomycetota bacterium]|nr:SHOCT domain-containing protein [Actinomycetota bacterium]